VLLNLFQKMLGKGFADVIQPEQSDTNLVVCCPLLNVSNSSMWGR